MWQTDRLDFDYASVQQNHNKQFDTNVFIQFSMNGISLGHHLWERLQWILQYFISLLYDTLGLDSGCLIGKYLTSVFSLSSFFSHWGDENCVPWPDSTHSGFVTLDVIIFINLLRQDLVVAVRNAYSLVRFVNVSKHAKVYLTPLPPTGSGPNSSKAHNCPGFDGK